MNSVCNEIYGYGMHSVRNQIKAYGMNSECNEIWVYGMNADALTTQASPARAYLGHEARVKGDALVGGLSLNLHAARATHESGADPRADIETAQRTRS